MILGASGSEGRQAFRVKNTQHSTYIDFRLDITASNGFAFNLHFKIVEDGEERNLSKNVEGNNIYFTCSNFGTGAGTSKPVEIATVNGKKMFIHFWLETIDESKQVHSMFTQI